MLNAVGAAGTPAEGQVGPNAAARGREAPAADRGTVVPGDVVAVDVIIPVGNKRPFLERCLRSVLEAAEASPLVRVTVIDHGSTDGSNELGAALCRGRARHLVIPGGTISAIRNAGARMADAPILSFLDCDCVVPRGYFDAVRRVMANPEVAAAGRRVDYPADGRWLERTWHAMHESVSEGFRKYLNSGNFVIRREVFERVGGFDEALETGEDSELGQRLNALGFRIWESADLAVLHVDNPQSIGAFFRKELWHGRGMLGTARMWPPQLLLLSVILHALLLVAAAGWVALGSGALAARMAVALGLAFGMPVLAVLFRVGVRRRRVSWLSAVVLYQAYLLARIGALAMALSRPRRRSATLPAA